MTTLRISPSGQFARPTDVASITSTPCVLGATSASQFDSFPIDKPGGVISQLPNFSSVAEFRVSQLLADKTLFAIKNRGIYEYRSSEGAGLADDGDWVLRSTAVALGAPGRAFKLSSVNRYSKLNELVRQTDLDLWLQGRGELQSEAWTLMRQSAAIVCPFRFQDRYWNATDNTWKTRSVTPNSIELTCGNASYAMSQIPYTGGKGLYMQSAGATQCLRIPNSLLNPDGAFTLALRYQRPPGVNQNYSMLFSIGDTGGGSGTGRIWARLHGTSEGTMTTSAGTLGNAWPSCSYAPRVIVVSAAAGATGNTMWWLDGVLIGQGAKLSGTLSGNDNLFSGFWNSGTLISYLHWYLLDLIVVPTAISTTDEALALTRTLQFEDTPTLNIFAGQSNCYGSGRTTDTGTVVPELPDRSVLYYDASIATRWRSGFSALNTLDPTSAGIFQFGPELTLAPTKPSEVWVKWARNGTGATGWYQLDIDLKIELQQSLLRAFYQLSCKPIVNNFVWLQGETDGENAAMTAATYQGYLTNLANYMRLGCNRSAAQMRFVIGRLNVDAQNVAACVKWSEVRAGEALFAGAAGNPGVGGGSDSNSVLIDLDSQRLKTADYHYAGPQVLAVGNLLAVGLQ